MGVVGVVVVVGCGYGVGARWRRRRAVAVATYTSCGARAMSTVLAFPERVGRFRCHMRHATTTAAEVVGAPNHAEPYRIANLRMCLW